MTWWQWLLICSLSYLFIGIQLGKASEWIFPKIYANRVYETAYTSWQVLVVAWLLHPFATIAFFGTVMKTPCVHESVGSEKEYYALKAIFGLPWHISKVVAAVIVLCILAICWIFWKILIRPMWKTKETLASIRSGVRYLHSKIKRRDQVVQGVAAAVEHAAEPFRTLTTEERITELEQRMAQTPDGQLLAQLRMQLMHEQEGTVPYRGTPDNTRVADIPMRVDADDELEQERHRGVAVSTTYV